MSTLDVGTHETCKWVSCHEVIPYNMLTLSIMLPLVLVLLLLLPLNLFLLHLLLIPLLSSTCCYEVETRVDKRWFETVSDEYEPHVVRTQLRR